MNNAQVAHSWAQQTNRSGKGSHFFFEGKTIYSYGYHFPIARFSSPNEVLLTTQTSSVSTSRHIGYVRQAIRQDATVFHVVDVGADSKARHLDNFVAMRDAIKSQLDDLAKCRTASTKTRTVEAIINRVDQANTYSKHFKLGRRITLPPGQSVEELTALVANWNKKEAAAENRWRKAQEKKSAEALDEWLLGSDNYNWLVRKLPDYYLRIGSSPTGQPIVQTSQGAEFPLIHAKRAYPVLKRVVANELSLNDVAITLGAFKVDYVEQDGTVVAGCHRVRWEEVQRLARLLGLCD